MIIQAEEDETAFQPAERDALKSALCRISDLERNPPTAPAAPSQIKTGDCRNVVISSFRGIGFACEGRQPARLRASSGLLVFPSTIVRARTRRSDRPAPRRAVA